MTNAKSTAPGLNIMHLKIQESMPSNVHANNHSKNGGLLVILLVVSETATLWKMLSTKIHTKHQNNATALIPILGPLILISYMDSAQSDVSNQKETLEHGKMLTNATVRMASLGMVAY